MSMLKKYKFSEAINLALFYSLKKNSRLFCFGLGINDPKRIFNTTNGLVENFGKHRVFDTPTSENGMTGYSIGAALKGFPSVATHQRVDFFLLAMDQLVNSAAKWNYMFGGKTPVPITIRLIVGKGWGQGPTHSQHLHSWFAHFPGLKVVCPTNSNDAYHLLIQAIEDKNPVIFFEHRWLHNSESQIDFKLKKNIIGKSKVIKKGKDLTIVTSSVHVIDCLRVIEILKDNDLPINIELIDIRSYKPLDIKTIISSVKKTKKILIIDPGFESGSFANEILAKVSISLFKILKERPIIISAHDIPEPTSYHYTKFFNISVNEILNKILKHFYKKKVKINMLKTQHHDIPGDWFKGPF